MNRIEEISNKLYELGFVNFFKGKPSLDEWLTKSKNVDNIINLVGTSNMTYDEAEKFWNKHNEMIYNLIPDKSFDKDRLSIGLFFKDNLVEITTTSSLTDIPIPCGPEEEGGLINDFLVEAGINKEGEKSEIIASRELPLKKLSIDEFYDLFIIKGFSLDVIIGSGVN